MFLILMRWWNPHPFHSISISTGIGLASTVAVPCRHAAISTQPKFCPSYPTLRSFTKLRGSSASARRPPAADRFRRQRRCRGPRSRSTGPVNFEGAKFSGTASFRGQTFTNDVFFNSAAFGLLSGCQVKWLALRGEEIEGPAAWKGAGAKTRAAGVRRSPRRGRPLIPSGICSRCLK
jgi:hypothetical protein